MVVGHSSALRNRLKWTTGRGCEYETLHHDPPMDAAQASAAMIRQVDGKLAWALQQILSPA